MEQLGNSPGQSSLYSSSAGDFSISKCKNVERQKNFLEGPNSLLQLLLPFVAGNNTDNCSKSWDTSTWHRVFLTISNCIVTSGNAHVNNSYRVRILDYNRLGCQQANTKIEQN